MDKALMNRERFANISQQIMQAEALLDMLRAEPQGSAFELRPAYASPKVAYVSREIMATAMRAYLREKEEVLERIEQEFSSL